MMGVRRRAVPRREKERLRRRRHASPWEGSLPESTLWGELHPSSAFLVGVMRLCGAVRLPSMGGVRGDGRSCSCDVTLASRKARSRGGRAAQESCGGAEDLFASACNFSDVGFFTFYAGSHTGHERDKVMTTVPAERDRWLSVKEPIPDFFEPRQIRPACAGVSSGSSLLMRSAPAQLLANQCIRPGM
jgi:hypothetical protein